MSEQFAEEQRLVQSGDGCEDFRSNFQAQQQRLETDPFAEMEHIAAVVSDTGASGSGLRSIEDYQPDVRAALDQLDQLYVKLNKGQKLAIRVLGSAKEDRYCCNRGRSAKSDLESTLESITKLSGPIGFAIQFRKCMDGSPLSTAKIAEYTKSIDSISLQLVGDMKVVRTFALERQEKQPKSKAS